MHIDVQHRPSYALAVVHLDPDETVIAEGGAMVSKDTHVAVETSAGKKDQGLVKGLLSGLKRMAAGESFFQNRYTSAGVPGQITFAPVHVGDIEVHTLTGDCDLILQSTAFLCAAESIDIDAKWGGARSFFGGEGLIMLRASGAGDIAFNAFGGVRAVEVDGTFVVDTGHIVAFEDTLSFNVTRFGSGLFSSIFGGEGLVCTFQGTGRLWIQTRNPRGFGEAMASKLPPREH